MHMHHPTGVDNRPSMGKQDRHRKLIGVLFLAAESKVHFGKCTLWMVEDRENFHRANTAGHMYKKAKRKKAEIEKNKTYEFSFQVTKSR